ncbi:gastrin/cholecystokinin type B receptor-like [Pocillopora damicornis]|nr:gastrin/cholecystokinin type B receptor-like [Pocillopora damicornis]
MVTNMSTSNETSIDVNISEETSGESSAIKGIKLSLYAIIFLISVIGNTLVCVVIARRRRMRTVTNFFVLNLAASDLAITCICIPFDIPVQENHHKWLYGKVLCKLLYPIQTMAVFSSIFTLTAVSLNRFWAIVYPLRKQMTKKHAFVVIVVTWVVCALLTVPYVVVLNLNETTNYCEENWPGIEYRKAYTASLFALQYLLPLCMITIAYLKIGLELRTCVNVKRRYSVNSVLHNARRNEARKVVRMLIVVTLLFAICVLPNNVMWLWLDFGNGASYSKFWDMVAFTNIILFANSAANPIAYTICHENFREEFKLYFTCDPKIFQSMAESTITYTRSRLRSLTGQDKNISQTVEYNEILITDEVLIVDAKETVI